MIDSRAVVATVSQWAESGQYPASRTLLWRACKSGRLRHTRAGRRCLVFRTDLESWIRAGMPLDFADEPVSS